MKAKRILINKKADFKKLLRQLKDADVISLDTETSDLFRTSMLVEKAEPIVGFCFATREGEGYYIPIRHNFGEQLDADYVIKELKKILEDPSKSIGGHNIKYDLMVCRNEGINFKPSWDSMLETHLAGDGVVVGGSREKLGLKDLAADKFNIRMKKLTDYFGTKKKIDMAALDIISATEYAAADPDITLRLHNLEKPKVKGGMLYKVEMLLIPIVLDMEMKGIQLDLPFMAKEKEKLLVAAEMTRKMIMDYLTEKLGYEVDINLASTQQVGDMFHDKLGIPAQGKTPTGRYCTSDDVYEPIRDDYPIIHNLLTLRGLKKAANDFYGGYADAADQYGILRTSYNPIGASSGRFSSSDPNAQNVAKFSEWFIKLLGSAKDAAIKRIEKEFKVKIDAMPRTEDAFTVIGVGSDGYEWVLLKSGEVAIRIDTKRRKAFIARPGKKLVEPDYDQIESKVIGAMAGEKKLLAQFARMEDIHSQVASEMLGIPLSKITKKLREIGKAFNHAIPYGISEYGVARRLKISVEEALQHLNSYFAARAAIKAYIDRTRDKARITKKVTTFFGRIQPVPEFYGFGYKMMARGERACVNRIIQGCKCAGTVCWTNKGFKKVEDLEGKKFKVWTGKNFVCAEGVDAGYGDSVAIHMHNKVVYRCSTGEPILTLNNEAELEWKKAEDLRKGDVVVFSGKYKPEGRLDFDFKGCVHNAIPFSYHGEISEELGELLGRFGADGYWRGPRPSIAFHSEKEADDCIYYEKTAKKLGLWCIRKEAWRPSRRKTGRKPSLTLEFTTAMKKLLDMVFDSDRNVDMSLFGLRGMKGFLKGYFSGDGGWVGHSIVVTAKNRYGLLKQVWQMLLALGIKSIVTKANWYRCKEGIWRLVISDTKRYMKIVGFRQRYKQEHFVGRGNSRRLPKSLQLKIIETADRKDASDVLRSTLSRGTIGLLLARITKHSYHDLLDYQYSEVDRVESIGKQRLYDVITYGKHQRVVADGLIVHNTSADILKISMVRTPKILKERHGDKVDMLLTNHDALMFEVDEDMPDNEIIKSIIDIMTFGIKGFPLFTVSIKKGDNWAEMKSIWGADEWKEMIKLWSLDKVDNEVKPVKVQKKKGSSYNKEEEQKITVRALNGITKDQAKKLVALLDNNVGSNVVVLAVNDFSKVLDKHLTSLSISDAEVFKAIFPCRVSIEKSDVKVKELLK